MVGRCSSAPAALGGRQVAQRHAQPHRDHHRPPPTARRWPGRARPILASTLSPVISEPAEVLPVTAPPEEPQVTGSRSVGPRPRMWFQLGDLLRGWPCPRVERPPAHPASERSQANTSKDSNNSVGISLDQPTHPRTRSIGLGGRVSLLTGRVSPHYVSGLGHGGRGTFLLTTMERPAHWTAGMAGQVLAHDVPPGLACW